MMTAQQPLVDSLRDALNALQSEPGPMTPQKAELISYLRECILGSEMAPSVRQHRTQANPV